MKKKYKRKKGPVRSKKVTFDGIKFLISDITVFEMQRTAITANVITNAISSLVVTASAEQIPKTCKLIGLLLINGSATAFFDCLLKSATSLHFLS